MIILLQLIAALLPALLLWIYIWKKDPRPEPVSWLLKALLLGVLICIPVAFLELGIETLLFGTGGEPSDPVETTLVAFIVAALPEELFKLLALWLVLRKNPFFDEHYDGIVYAVCVGLGFAAIENVFYVLSDDEWWLVAIGRALLAVPGHYAYAVLMGYYYSLYHFADRTPKTALCILLVPVLLHGVYDSIVMVNQIDASIGALSLPLLLWFCVKLHKSARKKLLAMVKRDEENPLQGE
jgi:RsiW-degrading membrane proteinase PrsW (M82 family)